MRKKYTTITTTHLGTILSRYPPSYLHFHPLIPIFKRPPRTMHLTAVRQTDLGSKRRKEMPPPGEPPCHQQTQLRKQLAPPPMFSVPSWGENMLSQEATSFSFLVSFENVDFYFFFFFFSFGIASACDTNFHCEDVKLEPKL